MNPRTFKYQSGFGNEFATEALKGALPEGQNNPQKCPFGLYAEQLSGSAFTVPQAQVLRSWLYRIKPSVCHQPFHLLESPLFQTAPIASPAATPNQLRWDAFPMPKTKKRTFLESLTTFCVSGSAAERQGSAVHLYACTMNMQHEFFYNSDGETLIIPQDGGLILKTELGSLTVDPLEVVVIPRGVSFQVQLKFNKARGYVLENYGSPFILPDKGPIGSNGLANPRDFQYPVARYEERQGNFKLINKFHGRLWEAEIGHSPFNVVAWHGNYAPYKYDLSKFVAINSVSVDHCDPSIFTVLTSPSAQSGTANADFVIFPPRWSVSENTFRPPWFHRNVMSEYMGLITGAYDAKASGPDGFVPGGGSLHNCMSAHGPDKQAFESASKGKLQPQYMDKTMAFMLESRTVFHTTEFALSTDLLQKNYFECWQDLKSHFKK